MQTKNSSKLRFLLSSGPNRSCRTSEQMTIRIQCQSKRHLLLLSSLCIALFYLYLAFQTYYISVILGRFVAIARTITPSFPHFVSFAFHLLSTHVFLLPVMSKPSQTPCVRINLLMPPKLPL